MPRGPSTILTPSALASYAASDPNHPRMRKYLAHHYHPDHTDLLSPNVVPTFIMAVYEHYTDFFYPLFKRAFISDVRHPSFDYNMSTVPYQQRDQHP